MTKEFIILKRKRCWIINLFLDGLKGVVSHDIFTALVSAYRRCPLAEVPKYVLSESKGSVSQLMDDLDLIIEQVEVMVNSIQKGVENILRKQCRLKILLLL